MSGMSYRFLAADAHKWLLGPEGIGIFYCRKELAEQSILCSSGGKVCRMSSILIIQPSV
jgi:selenocysteine lyase/cysteine desulfurase